MKTEVIRLVSMMDNDEFGVFAGRSYYGTMQSDGNANIVLTWYGAPTHILLENVGYDTFIYGYGLMFIDASVLDDVRVERHQLRDTWNSLVNVVKGIFKR